MPRCKQAFSAHSKNTFTGPSTFYLRNSKGRSMSWELIVPQQAQNVLCLAFLTSVLEFLKQANFQCFTHSKSSRAEPFKIFQEACMFLDHIKWTMRHWYLGQDFLALFGPQKRENFYHVQAKNLEHWHFAKKKDCCSRYSKKRKLFDVQEIVVHWVKKWTSLFLNIEKFSLFLGFSEQFFCSLNKNFLNIEKFSLFFKKIEVGCLSQCFLVQF